MITEMDKDTATICLLEIMDLGKADTYGIPPAAKTILKGCHFWWPMYLNLESPLLLSNLFNWAMEQGCNEKHIKYIEKQ